MYLKADPTGWVVHWETVEEMKAINQSLDILRERFPSGETHSPNDAEMLAAWANHLIELDAQTISGPWSCKERFDDIMRPHRGETGPARTYNCGSPSQSPSSEVIAVSPQGVDQEDTSQTHPQCEPGNASSPGVIYSANVKGHPRSPAARRMPRAKRASIPA